jgi:transcriptional repressor NrdR
MRCPFCDAEKESLKVIDSRTCDGGKSIRRRRECLKCDKRFTTYERIENPIRLNVIKKDGRRVPWDRDKILVGLERACFKRPVPKGELMRIVDEVEDETFRAHDREVPTAFVGQLVAEKLRRLDQVAYVRFASVYRQFKTVEELIEEAKAVLDAKRFEDPEQGRLFIEASQAASGTNGKLPAPAAEQTREQPENRPRRPRKAAAPAANQPSPEAQTQNV